MTSVKKMASLFFIGQGFGVILFFMPDKYGRKATMKFTLPFYILSQYFILFQHNISIKSIGFFMQGFFHIKITNSFTHIIELVPDIYKSKVSTLIVAFNVGSVALVSFLILNVDNDENHCLKAMFWLGILSMVVYFLVVPESPRFLLMNQKNK